MMDIIQRIVECDSVVISDMELELQEIVFERRVSIIITHDNLRWCRIAREFVALDKVNI